MSGYRCKWAVALTTLDHRRKGGSQFQLQQGKSAVYKTGAGIYVVYCMCGTEYLGSIIASAK